MKSIEALQKELDDLKKRRAKTEAIKKRIEDLESVLLQKIDTENNEKRERQKIVAQARFKKTVNAPRNNTNRFVEQATRQIWGKSNNNNHNDDDDNEDDDNNDNTPDPAASLQRAIALYNEISPNPFVSSYAKEQQQESAKKYKESHNIGKRQKTGPNGSRMNEEYDANQQLYYQQAEQVAHGQEPTPILADQSNDPNAVQCNVANNVAANQNRANRNAAIIAQQFTNDDAGSDSDDPDDPDFIPGQEDLENEDGENGGLPPDYDPDDGTYADFVQAFNEGEPVDVEVQLFNPLLMKKDALVMVVGKRRFGKSVFTQWCLSYLWKYYPDGAYVFTTTKHNWFGQQHVPDSRVYPGADFEVINEILRQQMEKWENRKKTGEKELSGVVLIFDDCISERRDSRYSEDMLRLAFNGRHYGISVWLLTQDVKGYFPDIRSNCDYAAITYQLQTRQTKTIRDDWAGFFPDDNQFGDLLRKNTQNYQLLVIDQSEANYDFRKGTFFVAKPVEVVEDYRIGDAEFWHESGCNWKEQLKIWKNISSSKLGDADYEELADKRLKKSIKDEKKRKREHGEDGEYRTAASAAARGKDRERLHEKALEHKGFKTGTKTWDEFEKHMNQMFIPTQKGYLPSKRR